MGLEVVMLSGGNANKGSGTVLAFEGLESRYQVIELP